MKLFAEPAGSRHRVGYLLGAVTLIAAFLSLLAGRANADHVYWANQNSIAYSALDDSEGGFLPPSVFNVHGPSGTAIDTANDRIYMSEVGSDQIVWFGLDGVSSGVVNTAPGTVDNPSNIAIDPASQTLYWANDDTPGSIGYAYVNESGGGILVKSGSTAAHVQQPAKIAVDTLHNRVYWWNEGSEEFSWVTMDGLTGANLTTPGLSFNAPEELGGMAIEPYSTPQELYFLDNEAEGIFHTDPSLGGEPERVIGAYAEKNTSEPTGLAFDFTDLRFYWANHATDEEPPAAIGTATLFGRPGTITVFPVAPIHNPVFAAILKEPEPVGAPQLSVSGATLGCTLGEWEGDHPGASVYAAPTSFNYQWRKGSTPIPGATESSFTATETGSYSCTVAAENAAGEADSNSKSTTLTFPAPPKPKTTTASTSTAKPKPKPKSTAGSAKLASSKPVKVKAGGTAAIKVDLANSGETTLGSTKVCGSLPKQARKGLKTPACVTVKSVPVGKTVIASLQVKTLASARGIYKFTVSVSGAVDASLTAKVQVTKAKSKK